MQEQSPARAPWRPVWWALTANVLAFLAQIPELCLLPTVNGMKHYPVLGRMFALAVALVALVTLVPMSLRRMRQDAARSVLTPPRWLSGGLAVSLALSVLPLTLVGLWVAAGLMHVRFFWR